MRKESVATLAGAAEPLQSGADTLADHLLRVGGGQFDPVSGSLNLGQRQTRLRPRTAALLAHLVRNSHRLVGKDELLQAVWPDVVVTEDSLVQCIKEIRRALGVEGQDWIRTVPRQGYAFVGTTAEPAEDASPRAGTAIRLRGWPAVLGLAGIAASIALAGVHFMRGNDGAGVSAPPQSVIVLPIANLTRDPANEDIVDELTERLTVALAQLPGATVIAPGTAFTLKGQTVDARHIGTELAVRYVLEGSVRQSTSNAVINMRLVDATNAAQLWHDEFTADLGQKPGVSEDLLARVAETLGLRLLHAEAQRSNRDRPDDPGADDLLIRARAALRWAGQGQEGMTKAQRLLHEVVRRDENVPEAWALLALTYLNEIRFSNAREEGLRRAVESLEHAVALDPDDTLVREVRARVLYNQGRMPEALAAFDRAIELRRNDPVLHAHRGAALVSLGRPDEGLAAVERAIRLSPRDPQLPMWLMFQGVACLHLARDAEAVEVLQRAVEGNPKSAFTRLFFASALGAVGRVDEARVQVAELQRIAPGFTISRMRQREPSQAQAFQAQRQHLYEGLRRAGLPE